MGAWGGLCTFRPATLLSEVVPVLRTGCMHPVLVRVFERAWRPTDALCFEVARAIEEPEYEVSGEYAHRLFEVLVDDLCLGQTLVLGWSHTSAMHLDPGGDAPLTGLLTELDTRGERWTNDLGGHGEGVRGWLEVEETALLASRLTGVSSGTLRSVRAFAQNAAESQQGLLFGTDLDAFYP